LRLREKFHGALVTGAGSGLGAAFVELLLGEGVPVWGTSRRPERLPARSGFAGLALELRDPASVASAWVRADAEAGGIDLLINNAGGAVFGPMSMMSAKQWEDQLATLLFGPARLARHALAAMRVRGHGTIVNVTSLAVEFPIPYLGAYNAAKSALARFTATLQREAEEAGVVVIEFRPGDFRTNFNRAMAAQAGFSATEPRIARVWSRLDELMQRAPAPARAAADLRAALLRGRSGRVRSGSFFQAKVAPWGNRLLPGAMMRLLRSLYFRTGFPNP
jgi:NAD(P)-dependent dehydrogenase (short-subunit alcohol dehydrogenase family)